MEDTRPIRIFLKVAEQRSFAAAARAMGVTPAAATRAVARLEEDLGQQLLVRTTRQVSLTSAGALVAARYRPLMNAFDAATRDLTHASRPDRGHLRINAPLSMGLRLLPDLTARFRAAYPEISLSVTLTDRLVDIMDEPTDLAIRISAPPEDKSTIWRKICVVPRYLVAAPGLMAEQGAPQGPEDLNPALCLAYSPTGGAEQWEFRRGGQTRVLRSGAGLAVNNGDFLAELAIAGAGLAVLPEFLVSEALAQGDLVRVLPDWDLPPLWLTLYYPPYEQLPPLVGTFSAFFEGYLRDGLGWSLG